jgi:hypothetical protein
LCAYLSVSSAALAIDITGQSRTYLQSRESVDSTKFLPLYEYLDFRADDIGTKAVSFHVGGWYRHDLESESYGTRSTGDLQYAYLMLKHDKGNAFLHLGRVAVHQGVASAMVDGAAAGADLDWGFGLSAFGGVPVETAFDTRKGDSIYGGRISQGREGLYRIGVSHLLERNNSTDVRKEEGIDLWFRPFNAVELLGSTQYNALTSATARNAYYLTLAPFKVLSLRTEFTEISYKDYFTSTNLSVFQFQPGGPVDPNEKLKTVGEEAALVIGSVSASVDYKKYTYRIAGSADYYGARLTYAGMRHAGAGLSFHRMDGNTDALRYDESRIYGRINFNQADLTADLLAVTYDAKINGVKNAYSASLAAGYDLTAKARLGADIEYAKNPYFDRDIRGMVKFVYNFDLAPATKGDDKR